MSKLKKWDKEHVWHPFTQMQTAKEPILFLKAEKSKLYDENGLSYLDCNSSWWTNILGHGNKKIRKAVNKQFKELDHTIFAFATNVPAIKLAQKIIEITPKTFQKVFFSDNGSTSVEVALKMVFQYWSNKGTPKKRIIAMQGAYHGDTFGAMSVGERGYFNKPFEPFFFDVDYIDFPTHDNQEKILEDAENLLKTRDISALIVEPLVQGSAGMRMYSSVFLDKLCALAKKHEALIIFDEVMTGWYRTGRLFAMDHCEEKPDIICLSKGLTGGVLPLGLTVTTNKIFDAFLGETKEKALLHGHSFTGNALSCAAALASIKELKKDKFQINIKNIRKQHLEFIKEIGKLKNVKNARSFGTICAFELENKDSNYFSDISEKAHSYFLDKGMFVRTLGNTLFFNPPYSFTDDELKHCYEQFIGFASDDGLL